MITNNIILWASDMVNGMISTIPGYAGMTFTESIIGPVTDVTSQGTNNGPAGIFLDPTVIAALTGTLLTMIFAFFSAKIAIFLWQQVKW